MARCPVRVSSTQCMSTSFVRKNFQFGGQDYLSPLRFALQGMDQALCCAGSVSSR
jgi:hypothetical protein